MKNMIKEIVEHHKIKFLANLWVVVLTLFIGFNLVSAASSWQYVGSAGFSSQEGMFITQAFDSKGTPYVAFEDAGNSRKATVMKYAYNSATSKTEWHNVGSAKFSAGWANFMNLAFDKNNTPYVAFQDSDNSNLATVMKYAYNSATSKTEWHNVGSAGFSNGTAHNMTFAIDSNNVPYVAYWYGGSSKTIDVMRYDASSSKWGSVGSSSLPSGEMVYSSSTIVFDSSNTPYILINDNAKSLKVSVFKYDTSASKWAPVGAQGFTSNAPLSSFLSINSANVLHVAFLDLVSGKYKVSVVRYDETLSSEKDITEFKIGSDKGDIDQPKHTILVKVGCATDVTKLAPDITISKGATISPKSGAVQDFTNPVTYVVTAEDGSKQSYVVTVYKLSCEKEITEFTGGNGKGKIDQTNHTIDLDVKCNIDITK
ncbi:MAG: hypothetical protein QG594_1812, partial [Bacteroidota bacterium]|nr:hypothetical protein [Bacteroidota bacterium]